MRFSESMVLWVLSGLAVGCTSLPSPALQTPYFSGGVSDSKLLQGVIRKESQLAVKCAGKPLCDHVFFSRALAALYESRESAIHYFEKVIAVVPKSPLAETSRLWLQLLHTPSFTERRSVCSAPTPITRG